MSKQSISVMPFKEAVTQDLRRVSDRLREVFDSISRRAFEIFEAKGKSPGHEVEDWFRAESELLQPTPVEMKSSGGVVTVRAEVPGFKANEIEVTLDPCRLTIVGRRETQEERKTDKQTRSEQSTVQILRVIDFPRQVSTEGVTANLKDGVLELTLHEAVVGKIVQVKSQAA